MEWFEAILLFLLWFLQFVMPHLREEMVVVYTVFIIIELIRTYRGKRGFIAFKRFGEQYKNHVKRGGRTVH